MCYLFLFKFFSQFVRRVTGSNQSKVPRRKFSMIREHFESPEVKRRSTSTSTDLHDRRTTSTSTDLYENISNNQLDSARDRCKSVPSVLADFELRADQKYNDQFGAQFEQKSRSHWSTASFQKVPPTLGQRNVPNRRSMSVLSESSSANSFQLPPKGRPENKENQFPFPAVEKAPAIPPRASTRLAQSRSTLSPKSRVFSKLI